MIEDIPVSDDKVVDEAARAPSILFEYSATDEGDSDRGPGLILTKEQLKNIKHYEVAGLALPVELKKVAEYLGYTTGAGKGLEAADFLKTFMLIHTHASSWDPLRTDLLSVGDRLEICAIEMQQHGKSMETLVTEIVALDKLVEYNIKSLEDVRALEISMGDKFPGIALDDRDKETVSEFSYILDMIFADVKERKAEATSIKVRLDNFAKTLSNDVRPALQLKLRLIDHNTLSADIKALKETIDRRADEIDKKIAEYNTLVQQAVGSASTLNIVGIAMSIYIGVDAERVRKERDKLRAEQARDIATMQNKNVILGSLNRVRLDLQDLDLIVIDADIATKNLATVWNKLSIFIEQSSSRVDGINDALSVRQFINQFRLVVAPWATIEKNASLLLDVFAQADKEFREEYSNQFNSLDMEADMDLLIPADYPQDEAPDLPTLRQSKQSCNDQMVNIKAFYTLTSYLPSLYQKFNRLNSALNQSHTELRDGSQKLEHDLDSQTLILSRLLEELEETNDDADRLEILEDITKEVSGTLKATRNETSTLESSLLSVSEVFDRASTMRNLTGLDAELTALPEEIGVVETSRAKLEEESATITAAIKAIESKGFGAIAQDTLLNAEKIAALGATPPQVAIIELALDLLKQSLEKLDVALNFMGLIRLRDVLRDRINACSTTLLAKQQELRTVGQRINMIKATHDFDDRLGEYKVEYRKVINTLRSYLRQFDRLTEMDGALIQEFIAETTELAKYLQPIR
jgi:hypothetical protein